MTKKYITGSTRSGWVEFDGVKHFEDIIIHIDGTISKRRKDLSKKLRPINFHTPLGDEELTFLSRENPEIIFIGTGQRGLLPLTDEAEQFLTGYTVKIGKTPDIIPEILSECGRFVAIIHVTC